MSGWWLFPAFLAGLIVGQQINAGLVKSQQKMLIEQQRMIDEGLRSAGDKLAAIEEFV